MNGSLQTKKGYYYVVISYKNDKGKNKQKWIRTGLPTVGGNKRKAEKILHEKIVEFQNIDFISPDKSLFSTFFRDWLELHKDKVQTSTYNGYLHMAKKYICPYFEGKNLKLDDLRPIDIERYYSYLLHETNLSPNTVIKHHQVLRRCLEYAYKNRFVTENICNYVDKPRKQFSEYSFLELDDINELLRAVKGHKLEIPVVFAVYYGLRRSEILGLTWDSINFDDNTIKIRQKVIRSFDDDGKLIIEVSKTLKTDASYREFPLIPQIKTRLLQHKQDISENMEFFGNTYSKKYQDFICVDEQGKLLTPDYLSSTYKKIVKKHKLRKSSFHSLRHSCGSLLLALGYDIKQIQGYLGHASYATTLTYYSHARSGFKENIADKLSETIEY